MPEPALRSSDSSSPLIRWLLATVIVVSSIAAYWPAINSKFIWDDDSYVTNNLLLRSPEGLGRIWIPKETPQYYPVVFTSFWIECQLWGLEPRGYHITNVVLHAINALLVWWLCSRLVVPGAWLIAAVFALHPVHVESVAWITERKNVLSGMFYLLSALAYLRFDADPPERDSRVPRHWIMYALSLACFVLALLSKSVTCSLPAALILMMLWQRKRLSLARLLPLIPMFVIGLWLGLHTASLERDHVKAIGPDFDFSFLDRCLIATKALLFYPWKVIWPVDLTFIYPRWNVDDRNAASYWSVGAVLLAGIGAIAAYFRGWRGPSLALAFFAGTIFPALGFFNIYPMIFSFVADHFQYLASLGIIVLVIGSIAWVLRNEAAVTALGCVLVPVLGVLTYVQCTMYPNPETLWTATLKRNPNAWIAHNNLVPILLTRSQGEGAEGRTEIAAKYVREARAHAEAAYELKKTHASVLSNLSEARRCDGALEEAILPLEEAMRLVPQDPNYPWQIGRLNATLHRTFEAKEAYRKAVELAPTSVMFRASFAQIMAERHEVSEAIVQLHAIADQLAQNPLRASPADALMLESLARSLALADSPQQAAEALMLAIPIAQRFGMVQDASRMADYLRRCLREAAQ